VAYGESGDHDDREVRGVSDGGNGDFEFERRFFVRELPPELLAEPSPAFIVQSYYLAEQGYALRLRVQASDVEVPVAAMDDDLAVLDGLADRVDFCALTVKSPMNEGTRYEAEREIDVAVGLQMIRLGGARVVKNRYSIWVGRLGRRRVRRRQPSARHRRVRARRTGDGPDDPGLLRDRGDRRPAVRERRPVRCAVLRVGRAVRGGARRGGSPVPAGAGPQPLRARWRAGPGTAVNAGMSAGWVDHAVWWHVYPLGFTGAPQQALAADEPVQHRLPHLVAWLDHLVELGCNGLLLGPVFAAQTHGYDTTDHLRLDSRLGDDADWDGLVAAARERGVRIVLDGVFNHVGRDHPRVVQALADGPDSPAGRWVRWADGPDGVREPAVFEGHGQLVALDHSTPEVAQETARIMTHWLDRGADGWRLDATYTIPPEFWREVLPAVRAAHPDVWVLGEMIHGDYAGYVDESGIDSVTQYELWKAIWSSVVDRNLFELAHALERHEALVARFLPHTFVGNHDVTRIASRITDPRHVTHALAVLLLVAGTPAVYAGDELGYTGVKEERAGGDDAIRPRFPATPQVPAGAADRFREHQRLIGLRRRHAWLTRGSVSALHVANEQLVLALRPRGEEAGGLVLALNLGDEPFVLPVATGEPLLTAGGSVPSEAGGVVAPHSWTVLDAAP
jgi:cyclomaltodextrinase